MQNFPTNDNRKWYREVYLQSYHWKNLRSRVIKPDKVCCACLNAKSIDAHHLEYKNLFDVTPQDLMALCRTCHKECHALLKSGILVKKRSKWGLTVMQCLRAKAILQKRAGPLTEKQINKALRFLDRAERNHFYVNRNLKR